MKTTTKVFTRCERFTLSERRDDPRPQPKGSE